MFNRKKQECKNCNSKIEKKFSYCPNCGIPLKNKSQEIRDYGLIGKNDYEDEISEEDNFFSSGITDKLIGSMMNSIMKNMDKQFKGMDKEIEKSLEKAEIKSIPNGIRIRIGYPGEIQEPKPQKSLVKKTPTPAQIKRMTSLPREQAKSSIKRLNNSIIYELSTPGVASPQDIFISKLEEGYEIKAIGSKKVYVNNLPVNLPMKKLSLINNLLLVEFKEGD